jgi:hypothetical protein
MIAWGSGFAPDRRERIDRRDLGLIPVGQQAIDDHDEGRTAARHAAATTTRRGASQTMPGGRPSGEDLIDGDRLGLPTEV